MIAPRRQMSATPSAKEESLAWAKRSLLPLTSVAPSLDWGELSPIGQMIGDASIVALCEAEHFVAEPLEYRNRLLQYLVQEKGFTAVAIESGIVESRALHEYARGGVGDAESVVAAGCSWGFDRLPQNRALVQWLREYNSDPGHPRKVNVYGFDVAGSPGNPTANRGLETALVETLSYLARVDAAASAAVHARLDACLPNIRCDPADASRGPGYCRLSRRERDTLTAAVADLIMLMERREADYIDASSETDYEWACEAALAARQVDHWLRSGPAARKPLTDYAEFMAVASDVRDRAQADNLARIARREGPLGKILVYGHNVHLSAAAVEWTWKSLESSDRPQQDVISIRQTHEAAGTYLRRRFGSDIVTIGHLIGHRGGERSGCEPMSCDARLESIDGWGAAAGVQKFLLDLRNAPPRVRGWLDRPRRLGRAIALPGECEISIALAVGKAFDALFYVDSATPACAPTAVRADFGKRGMSHARSNS